MILEDNIQNIVGFRVAHAVRINMINEVEYKFWKLSAWNIHDAIVRNTNNSADLERLLDDHLTTNKYE
jgi:hypothetical protein